MSLKWIKSINRHKKKQKNQIRNKTCVLRKKRPFMTKIKAHLTFSWNKKIISGRSTKRLYKIIKKTITKSIKNSYNIINIVLILDSIKIILNFKLNLGMVVVMVWWSTIHAFFSDDQSSNSFFRVVVGKSKIPTYLLTLVSSIKRYFSFA